MVRRRMRPMDIILEAGGLPERGNLIVPVGHDGMLSAAARFPGCGSGRPRPTRTGGRRRWREARPHRRPAAAAGPVVRSPAAAHPWQGRGSAPYGPAGSRRGTRGQAPDTQNPRGNAGACRRPGARRAGPRGRAGPGAGRAAARLPVHALSDRRRQGRRGVAARSACASWRTVPAPSWLRSSDSRRP